MQKPQPANDPFRLPDFGCDVVGTATRVEAALDVMGRRSDPVAYALAACGIPFVFSTGYGGDGIIDVHRDRPVLQKPFNQQDLAAALSYLLADKWTTAAGGAVQTSLWSPKRH